MIAVRWGAFTVAAVTVVALMLASTSVASLVLAVILLVSFLVLCWTLGAFSRTTWHEEPWDASECVSAVHAPGEGQS